MEMFTHMAGIQMTPVHYKGGGPALTDVIGGHVPMIILSTTLTSKPYQAGQLRILGIGSPKRLAAFPELPTIAESGLPGYEAVTWFGLFAPAGTPRDIVNKVNADVQKVLADAGIFTIGDLQSYSGDLRALVGVFSQRLRAFAFGNDDRPLELKNLKLVAFVQDNDSKTILQAVQVDLGAK